MENRPNPAFARVLRARRKICPALPRTLRFRAKLKGRGVDRDQSGDGRFGAQGYLPRLIEPIPAPPRVDPRAAAGNESELTACAGAPSLATSARAAVTPGGGERRAARPPAGARDEARASAFST